MSDKNKVKDSMLRLLQTLLDTEEKSVRDEFNLAQATLHSCVDLESILQVYEKAMITHPGDPQLYYGAAKAAWKWSDKRADDYYDSKGVLGMELFEWMFGAGTPYRQFVELREKAAQYLQRVIELTPDISRDTVASIRNDIEHLLK